MSRAARVLLVGFHYPHHAARSGYDQLRRHLDAAYLDAASLPFGHARFGSLRRRVNLLFLEWHARRIAPDFDLVHYLYPEDHLGLSLRRAAANRRVATLHLPAEWYAGLDGTRDLWLRMRRRALERLDGIIVLCRDDEAQVAAAFPRALVRYIPHGVEFVTAPRDPVEAIQFVTVGDHLRDAETYLEVARRCAERHPDWVLHLVGAGDSWRRRAAGCDNVVVHPRLDDDAYSALLAGSRACLLPLTRATANNALLEAHALGVPVVVTDCPGVRDYATEGTTTFCDADGAVRALERAAMRTPADAAALASGIRRGAARYAWDRVAEQTRAFYGEVLGR